VTVGRPQFFIRGLDNGVLTTPMVAWWIYPAIAPVLRDAIDRDRRKGFGSPAHAVIEDWLASLAAAYAVREAQRAEASGTVPSVPPEDAPAGTCGLLGVERNEVTVQEYASASGLSDSAIKKRITRDKTPEARKVDRRWLIPRVTLEAELEAKSGRS
jgi:hypothetical protein